MKILGIVIILVGAGFSAISFLGTTMMSRSVGMVTEAVLPALVGVIVAAIGLMLLLRNTPTKNS